MEQRRNAPLNKQNKRLIKEEEKNKKNGSKKRKTKQENEFSSVRIRQEGGGGDNDVKGKENRQITDSSVNLSDSQYNWV
jgi:hypothetical protein